MKWGKTKSISNIRNRIIVYTNAISCHVQLQIMVFESTVVNNCVEDFSYGVKLAINFQVYVGENEESLCRCEGVLFLTKMAEERMKRG